MMYVWLAFVVLFVIAECLTVGLVSIWFAGGSLVAMLLAMAGADIIWQVIAFLVVSGLLLIATRPFVKKYLLNKGVKTNYQSVIGEIVKVTETIDNFNQTGTVYADGKEWTARSTNDTLILEKGTLAKAVAIEGVKLMVEPYKSVSVHEVAEENNK